MPKTKTARIKPTPIPEDDGITYIDYEPRGEIRKIFECQDREVVLAGPAGTGKTRGCLEKINWVCEKHESARTIMIRKTRKSLTQSAMKTYEDRVLPKPDYVPFHTGEQAYLYPNGSILAVDGLDSPVKLYSSEWDVIYVPQAEELEAEDWQSLFRSLRSGRVPYQQIIADCNPGPPGHWLKQRQAAGSLRMFDTKHEDNPLLWDAKLGCWTKFGIEYIAGLDALTGALKARLRHGLWASAEGAIYEEVWKSSVHLIDRFFDAPLSKDQVPSDWPRYWVVDFGYTNPFVWQAWAEDPDGRLFRYKEIYRTKTLVEDHCREIKAVAGDDPKPIAILCDHDAEDRATFEKHMGLKTKAAYKSVGPGIQGVVARLRADGLGMPRMFFLRDSTIEVDQALLKAHLPTSTEGEIENYVWDTSSGRKKGDQPVKKDDHGCDCVRYLAAFVDDVGKNPQKVFGLSGALRDGVVISQVPASLEQPSAHRIGGATAFTTSNSGLLGPTFSGDDY